MSSTPTSGTDSHQRHGFSIVHLLEKGDGMAHVLVAILLLLLALGILISSTYGFVTDWIQHPATMEFAPKALKYLSDLLFGVIVLELLSTILTYIQARNLEATIKDFLVVGLISSIRKILLVGAQSSLEKSTGDEFQKEAMGTVVSIIGILLLIGGLLLLDRRMKAKAAAASAELE
jgi:uncharacterized membrane protein (DUF373 family)